MSIEQILNDLNCLQDGLNNLRWKNRSTNKELIYNDNSEQIPNISIPKAIEIRFWATKASVKRGIEDDLKALINSLQEYGLITGSRNKVNKKIFFNYFLGLNPHTDQNMESHISQHLTKMVRDGLESIKGNRYTNQSAHFLSAKNLMSWDWTTRSHLTEKLQNHHINAAVAIIDKGGKSEDVERYCFKVLMKSVDAQRSSRGIRKMLLEANIDSIKNLSHRIQYIVRGNDHSSLSCPVAEIISNIEQGIV